MLTGSIDKGTSRLATMAEDVAKRQRMMTQARLRRFSRHQAPPPRPSPYLELPTELAVSIAGYVPLRDILNQCSSNRQLWAICQSEPFWQVLYERDFGSAGYVKPIGLSYQAFYKSVRAYLLSFNQPAEDVVLALRKHLFEQRMERPVVLVGAGHGPDNWLEIVFSSVQPRDREDQLEIYVELTSVVFPADFLAGLPLLAPREQKDVPPQPPLRIGDLPQAYVGKITRLGTTDYDVALQREINRLIRMLVKLNHGQHIAIATPQGRSLRHILPVLP